jgi:serine phosphatase RsbU (regulator of sigma subunit)/PAS domain-containing protein/anti-sigma regulatory factor (Ser/Thr protein kinase)
MAGIVHGKIVEQLNPGEIPDAAIATINADGTVAGWTSTAQRLVGYPAGEIVGRPATTVLPFPPSGLQSWEFAERGRDRGGWSGTAAVRHRDGRMLHVSLRYSLLWGPGGSVRWLLSGTSVARLSSPATTGSVRESLLTRTPIGVSVHDREMRCTWVNETMERQDGIPRDKRLGRRPTESVPGFDSEALEAVIKQVLASGLTTVHEYRAWPLGDSDREHAFAAFFFCLQDPAGQALEVCCLNVDVTSSHRARERLAILSEAGTRMGSTLDPMRTSQELADLAVPLLADYVTVDLLEPASDGAGPLAPAARPEEGRLFRRTGMASTRPGVPEALWARGEVHVVPASSPSAKASLSGRSYLEPLLDTSPDGWIDRDPVQAEKVREHGMHSLMIVPIRARDGVLGVARFIRTEEPTPFQEDDLLVARELVTRAALSLDNARQYAREHTAALTLQRDLLPHRLEGGAAVELASQYRPADRADGVGGDWFDVIPLSGARVAMVVGDVVGHGINAAAAMGRLRTAVRTLADMELSPEDVLAHLDDTVQRMTGEVTGDPDDGPGVAGATCLYSVYDPGTQRCSIARAGHPPPAVVSPSGEVTFPDLPAGAPLGIGTVPFEAGEVELTEGSMLAFYTDGLIETRDSDIDEGMRHLGKALEHPDQSLEDLCTSVVEALPARPPSDDATLLLARTHSLDSRQTASWDLATAPSSVCDARGLVAQKLTEWGVGDGLISGTELIVSELVTNAITHGTGPITVRLTKHRLLTCEVSDTNQGCPRLRHPDSTDEHGRGIFLVSLMAYRWGCRWTADGKAVWAEQELHE